MINGNLTNLSKLIEYVERSEVYLSFGVHTRNMSSIKPGNKLVHLEERYPLQVHLTIYRNNASKNPTLIRNFYVSDLTDDVLEELREALLG